MIFLVFACQPNPLIESNTDALMTLPPWEMSEEYSDFSFSESELELLHEINAIRDEIGLFELAGEPMIGALARQHSENMSNNLVDVGHEGFQGRIASLYGDIEVYSAAENVAFDESVDSAIERWLDSSGHADNILGDYNLSGTGIAVNDEGQHFFTQIFVLGESLN